MSECPCSNIDEMDIMIIIEALEHNHVLYKSTQLNRFKETYFPKLIDKLQKWKEAREKTVLEGLESGNRQVSTGYMAAVNREDRSFSRERV